MNSAEDPTLLGRFHKGDNEAFRILAERYWSRLYRLALQVLRDHQEAEDVTQDALFSSYLQRKNFDPNRSFANWVFRITLNCALDRKRQKKRRQSQTNLKAEIDRKADTDKSSNPEHMTEQLESVRLIRRALDDLDSAARVLLVLRYFEGLSYKSIAEVTNKSLGSVEVGLHRAKKKLLKRASHYGL